jgi:methionyl aminopeptidase
MTFTIEPMINLGSYESKIMPDQWTVVTKDNTLSAQFEHSVTITKTGVEVLTIENQNKL